MVRGWKLATYILQYSNSNKTVLEHIITEDALEYLQKSKTVKQNIKKFISSYQMTVPRSEYLI